MKYVLLVTLALSTSACLNQQQQDIAGGAIIGYGLAKTVLK